MGFYLILNLVIFVYILNTWIALCYGASVYNECDTIDMMPEIER